MWNSFFAVNLGLITLIAVTHSELLCDGIEFFDTHPAAAGVCQESNANSMQYLCVTGKMASYYYHSKNCTGNAFITEDICADNTSSYTSCVCGHGGCDYAAIRSYARITGCNDDDTPLGYDSFTTTAYPLNHCVTRDAAGVGVSTKKSANATHLFEMTYLSAYDCDGTPSDTDVTAIGNVCVVDGEYKSARRIVVGTAVYTTGVVPFQISTTDEQAVTVTTTESMESGSTTLDTEDDNLSGGNSGNEAIDFNTTRLEDFNTSVNTTSITSTVIYTSSLDTEVESETDFTEASNILSGSVGNILPFIVCIHYSVN